MSRSCRLSVESLENRLAPAVVTVVPTAVTADQITSFYTVAGAFGAPNLAAGDTIQIEPGATPGSIGFLPNVPNLTIQGNPAAGPTDAGPLTLRFVTIDAAKAGLTFRNLHLVNVSGPMTWNANGTIDRVRFDNYHTDTGLKLNGVGGFSLTNSALTDYNPNTNVSTIPLLQVTPAAAAHNVITGNTFVSTLAHALLAYSAPAAVATTDVIARNRFVGNADGGGAASLVMLNGNVNGVTVSGNTLTDPDNAVIGIYVGANSQNITIDRNTIDFPGDGNATGIYLGGDLGTLGVAVTNNVVHTGMGLLVYGGIGTLSVKIEGNDFTTQRMGVRLTGSTATGLTGVDLGGGALGSKGGNNFRTFAAAATTATGAIVAVGSASTTVMAKGNLFGSAGTAVVVFDKADDATSATVNASNALTGHAAFVQALYTRFLRRAGDLGNANDAGGWVTQLNNGTPAATVANSLVRSGEALGLVVDDLYVRLLGRQADANGRAFFVAQLANGGTLESVTSQFLASGEYANRFPTSIAYAASLYATFLGRAASGVELANFAAQVNSTGRLAAAQAVLAGGEYRARVVRNDYADLLHRSTAPAAAEVNGWVQSGFDVLSIAAQFAATPEFQWNG